jgi:hypothetical protein
MHLLPGLIADIEFSIHDDLHFMVRVRVDKWSASLKSVETTADGLLSIDMVTINQRKRGYVSSRGNG